MSSTADPRSPPPFLAPPAASVAAGAAAAVAAAAATAPRAPPPARSLLFKNKTDSGGAGMARGALCLSCGLVNKKQDRTGPD